MAVKTALIIVDVQYDFLPPSGSMAVTGGDLILPGIYDLLDRPQWDETWDVVVATQDWHPKGHVSFASRHAGAKPYTSVKWKDVKKGDEVDMSVWPDHCIQGSRGADIEDGLSERLGPWDEVGKYACFRKAFELDIEAFSGFEGAVVDPKSEKGVREKSVHSGTTSELGAYLKEKGIERVVVVGLATDYVILPLSHIAGVAKDSSDAAIEQLRGEGVVVAQDLKHLKSVLDG